MFVILTFLRGALKALVPFLPWIAVGVVGAVLWTYTPWIGPAAQAAKISADRDDWKASAAKWQAASRGWEASFRSAETLRAREATTAQVAATSLIQQCSARVAEARASARTIERIVTKEPTYDENRCPARELVDPDLVRDALVPRPGTD